ncbi:SDR family oxidoreductase [Chroococcus sp. FPU101]|uniref:SDR family NAD(P)-dependent oxidoreductase n=1 Tax=Chroococcus sp. FPU101 TaxID=1974212 RepID=UPI001A8F3740|nr:SDR family oxidoreductase [Chroococcus sp. FPU101]GFE71381.1 short-chain dehydrogenase/reductase SDR [Chroococcus sp. FPU101]
MGELPDNLYFILVVGAIAFILLQILIRWWQESRYTFKDKTVLITGGSRGLGLVMARQLVHQGARVAICARDQAELERAKLQLKDCFTLTCDVTDQTQVEQMIQKITEHFGNIDVLINNAGIIQVGPIETMTLEDYDAAMKLHFWAPLYTTFAVLPTMRHQKAGRIVNISSIGGKISVPHLLPYSASKFALVGLSEGMRSELAKDGIKVTTVCPGLIRTGSTENAYFKGHHRAEYTWFTISDSLPILSMSAEAVARKILAGCRRGDSEIITSLPAIIGIRFHGVFPGLTSDILSWVNRLLPENGGIGSDRIIGKDSHSSITSSLLTALSQRAARQNNQLTPEEIKE